MLVLCPTMASRTGNILWNQFSQGAPKEPRWSDSKNFSSCRRDLTESDDKIAEAKTDCEREIEELKELFER